MKCQAAKSVLTCLVLVIGGCAYSRERAPRAAKPYALRMAMPESAGDSAAIADCYMGQPLGGSLGDVEVLPNDGYTVGFSPATRTPLWACYRLFHVENPEEFPRPTKDFEKYDKDGITVKHDDYTNSGYDRGHMAPSSGIAKCYGRDAQLGTFKVINICPQHPGLNQRCWERFEAEIADYYAEQFGEAWVITGPIYGESCVELTTDVRVPDAFFKIVAAEIDGQLEMLGIIMLNERTDRSPISDYVYSVDEIEELSGFDFFHELPDDVEDAAEAKLPPKPRWNTSWELRPVHPGAPRTINIRDCN